MQRQQTFKRWHVNIVITLRKWIIPDVVQNMIVIRLKKFTMENVYIVVTLQLEGAVTVQNTVVISVAEKKCVKTLD